MKITKNIMITTIMIVSTVLSVSALASADLTIDQVITDKNNNTFSTDCINTKGFYFEIGQANGSKNVSIYMIEKNIPFENAVKNLLPSGWKVHYGKSVDVLQKISWMGHKPWTAWLQKLAFEKNLAIILDWQTKTLYINRL